MTNLLIPLLFFALINVTLVALGFFIVKRKILWAGWVVFILAIPVIWFLFKDASPVLKMLVIIATTFTAVKIIVVPMEYRGKPVGISFRQWSAFAAGWVGMRAQPFETLGGPPMPKAWPLIRFGISRILLGAVMIGLAHFLVTLPLNAAFRRVLVSADLLVALSLILHFGLLGISAGMWRLRGANTYPLFRQPAESLSLTEFWGKRWNLAFSEMTAIIIFRPLRGKTGPAVALMASFIFSGILHELALSLPVNAGFGLPTLYFLLHGALVLVEKLLKDRSVSFLQNKFIARAWLFFWLVIPAPLLFHAEFIRQVVWPLAGLKGLY